LRCYDKTRLASDFVDIFTAEPSPFELPILKLSSYEFLWKTPHPFEENGVPKSLMNVDPAQFKSSKKTFAFNEIAGKVRDYFEKGYGLNFINEIYEAFIKKYIELAQISYFSYALVWELKVEYLEQLHEQMHKEALLEAKYAFYPEGPTWTITFDGKTIRGLRGKGFKYIHYLVLKKFKDYSHTDLDPLDSKPAIYTEQFEDCFNKNDSNPYQKKKKIIDYRDMADGKTLKDIKKEFKNIIEFLERAKRENNLIEIEMAQKEYDKFSTYYYEYLTQNGRSKKFKTKQKKIRDRIAKNMKEALDEIKKYDETIWSHFNDVLGGLYATSISYRPNPDIDWQT